MSFSIRQKEKESVMVLELQGPLTVGESASALRDSLRELAAANRLNAVLDLAGVNYIDSTGLGAMVVCFTTLRKAGGKLVLLNLNRRQMQLLLLTKLSTVFEIFDDEQDAVNSFFPDRQIRRFDILRFVEQHREGEAGSKE